MAADADTRWRDKIRRPPLMQHLGERAPPACIESAGSAEFISQSILHWVHNLFFRSSCKSFYLLSLCLSLVYSDSSWSLFTLYLQGLLKSILLPFTFSSMTVPISQDGVMCSDRFYPVSLIVCSVVWKGTDISDWSRSRVEKLPLPLYHFGTLSVNIVTLWILPLNQTSGHGFRILLDKVLQK